MVFFYPVPLFEDKYLYNPKTMAALNVVLKNNIVIVGKVSVKMSNEQRL